MSEFNIKATNICFSYPDGHEAIKDLSFDIRHGESVGIIGANGAGKSTLLMILMGLLFPVCGEIMIDGVLITKSTLPKIRQSLGMVFQNPDDQLFLSTVYEDVAFGPRNYKLDEEEVCNRVCDALEMVGISHLKERASFKLSDGEKRLAAIASVLSMQPEALIMDEPTSTLDPKARRRIIQLLNSLHHTKIITSHDLDMILDTCERVIVIKEGRIAADGKTKDILSDETLLDHCGLEMPLSFQKRRSI